VCDLGGAVRRPDLPLILIVLAVGAALAAFADTGPAAPIAGNAVEPAPVADPADAFLAAAGPGLLSCLAGDARPGRDVQRPPASEEELIESVSGEVEKVRELRFARPVDASFLTPAKLRRRVSSLLDEELPREAVAEEGEILELLGAIPAGSDLYELEEQALGSQVVGLYVPELRELLVQASGERGAVELLTLAHELEHALVDQRFGLRDVEASEAAADRALAYVSVVEGDATLTMMRYAVAAVGLGQLDSLEQEGVPGSERQFDRLPDYLQRSLLFPYFGGLQLVCARWLEGGFSAVDRLYAEPPTATDEILFPERYGDGPPAQAPDPGRPDPPWKLRTERELGAAELEWLFTAPGGDVAASLPEPRRLVSAWAGGEVELWANGSQRALGVSLVEAPGTDLLCGAMAAWYRSAFERAVPERAVQRSAEVITFFEADQVAVIACEGDQVRLGIGPNAIVAATLAGSAGTAT
jgi:hypothetical protein